MEWEGKEEADDHSSAAENEIDENETESDGGSRDASPANLQCFTCDIVFNSVSSLHSHILKHISLPTVSVVKLKDNDSEDEDYLSQSPASEEYDSEEESVAATPANASTVDKLGLSKLLSTLTVKKVNEINRFPATPTKPSVGVPINKPGITKIIPASSDLVQRLKQLGALKLKIKKQEEGTDFEVVNGEKEQKAESEDMELDSPIEGKQEMEGFNLPNKSGIILEDSVDEKPILSQDQINRAKANNGIPEDIKPPILPPILEPADEKPKEETLRRFQQEYKNNVSSSTNHSTVQITNQSTVQTSNQNTFQTSGFIRGQAANNAVSPSFTPNRNITTSQTSSNVVDSKENIIKLPLPKPIDTGITIDLDSDDDEPIELKPNVSSIDIKPSIISTPVSLPSQTLSINSSVQSSTSTPIGLANNKQHNFNWNAPIKSQDHLDKNADAILDRLLASAKDDETSEYISLDTLGPQQSCEFCNLRFTSLTMLEQHKKTCPSSKNLILPQSRQLAIPGNEPLGLLTNLLPVKHISDQMVGRLGAVSTLGGAVSTLGSSANSAYGQQNVLINIQSFPGQMGQFPSVQGYSQYQGQPYPNPNMPYNPMDSSQYRPSHQDPYGRSFGQSPGQSPMHVPPQMHSPQQQMQAQQAYNQAISQAGPFPRPNMPSPHQSYPQTSNQQGQQMQQSTFSPNSQAQPSTTFMQSQGPGQGSNNGFSVPGQVSGKSPSHSSPQANLAPRPGLSSGMRPPAPRSDQILNPKDPRGLKKRVILRPNMRWQEMAKMKMNQQKLMKRPLPPGVRPGQPRRPDMLLPGKHDSEDCSVLSMQRQINGMPIIDSIKGSRDPSIPNIGDSITITKTKCAPPPKSSFSEANKVASMLASRGIMIKPKTKPPTARQSASPLAGLSREVSVKQVPKPTSIFPSSTFKCRYCEKSFVTQSGLNGHVSTQHWEEDRDGHGGIEFGLPVVDLSQKSTIKRLNDLGITNFIPINKRESGGGCFGLPIVSLNDESRAGLQSLGAQGLLNLGPIKRLPY